MPSKKTSSARKARDIANEKYQNIEKKYQKLAESYKELEAVIEHNTCIGNGYKFEYTSFRPSSHEAVTEVPFDENLIRDVSDKIPIYRVDSPVFRLSSSVHTAYEGLLPGKRFPSMDFFKSKTTMLPSIFPHQKLLTDASGYFAPREYGISHNTQYQKLIMSALIMLESQSPNTPSIVYIHIVNALPACAFFISTPVTAAGEFQPNLNPHETNFKMDRHLARGLVSVGHLSLAFSGLNTVLQAVESLKAIRTHPICRITSDANGGTRLFSRRPSNSETFKYHDRHVPIKYTDGGTRWIRKAVEKLESPLSVNTDFENLSDVDKTIFVLTEEEGLEEWKDVIGETYVSNRLTNLRLRKFGSSIFIRKKWSKTNVEGDGSQPIADSSATPNIPITSPIPTTGTVMGETKEKVCLICIDGWGIGPVDGNPKGDAIKNAETPVMDKFEKDGPFCELEAHGLAVGLPEGLMGNSEEPQLMIIVGHLNIGAGRVVWQDLVRIDQSIKRGEFSKQENVVKALDTAKKGNGRLHLLGLVSDGGVHSHINHLFALLSAAKEAGVKDTYVHFFGDGRDTDPKSGAGYMQQLLDKFESLKYGKLGTVVGRYYAMDRDKRWERIQVALDALTLGKGEKGGENPVEDIKAKYNKKETDEFLKPICYNGDEGRIKDNDTLIFFNYRSDRVREIVQILYVDPSPLEGKVTLPSGISLFTMSKYNPKWDQIPVIFPPQRMSDVLAEWLSKHKIAQCHIAETEKYAHVTFFFNGGVEKQYPLEDREMIPSPKVATYDLDPKMSVHGVADKTVEVLETGKYPFIILNLANPDMVGHTGVYNAAVEAVGHCDQAIGTIYEACKKLGYILFVTSDHGNAEKMLADDGVSPHTAHTTAHVPFVMTETGNDKYLFKISGPDHPGVLADVAPTILDVMGLGQPEDMTGQSLIKH